MNNAINDLRHLTSQELHALGIQDIAYVKKITEDGVTAFAVHAADGTRLGVMATRELAFAALRQHDLEPVSVH
ncbi:MAG TPA: DUF1150 family protein [Alphaproteobacteria bacterium]|nr:DUF1150 family protein [Alphaproteobacteria bacterium]